MKGRSSHTELAALVQQLHLDLQHRAAPTCHLDHRLLFGFVSRSLRGVDNQAYRAVRDLCAPSLVLLSANTSCPNRRLENIPLKIFRSDFLHTHFALHRSSQHFLLLIQVLNFFPECQASPLQHNQLSHMLLPSLHTGDFDLVCSLSDEDLEQVLRLPRNAVYVDVWLIWRQNLFLQLFGAYFRSFTFVQVTQYSSCDSLLDCCPILNDFVVNFLRLPP